MSFSIVLAVERVCKTAMAGALDTKHRVLIYSATRDYRHESIPTAIEALTRRGKSINVWFESTEDESWFVYDRLCQYDAIVFLSNSGEGELAAS